MDRERLDPRVLESPCEVHDRHMRLGAPADAGLHGDGQRDRRRDSTRHRHHRRGVTQPAGARATPRDRRDPAPAVEIDERGLGAFRDARGREEQVRIGAVDLDRRRAIVSGEARAASRELGIRDDLLGADELRHAQRCAERAAHATEGHVGDIFHRREHDRCGVEQRGDRIGGDGSG